MGQQANHTLSNYGLARAANHSDRGPLQTIARACAHRELTFTRQWIRLPPCSGLNQP